MASAGIMSRVDGSGPAEVVVTAAGQGLETVELVNRYDKEVLVELKGQSFQLGPGQTGGPVPMAPSASGNDVVELAPSPTRPVAWATPTTCPPAGGPTASPS